MQVIELNENHRIAAQPPGAKIPLKRHQLTLLNRCIEFEMSTIEVKKDTNMDTQIGIIGDKVGSGKSFVILSLMLSPCEEQQTNKMKVHSYGRNRIILSDNVHKPCIKTNILVIPHNLVSQWTEYVAMFCPPTFNYIVLNKTKDVDTFIETDPVSYDLIVLKSTFYNRIATFMRERNHKVKRVFFDEIDNMNIPSSEEIDSGFYWFVTASYNNLVYPRGHSTYDRTIQRYIMLASGLRNGGFVKDIFMDLSMAEPQMSARLLVVKNSDEYISTSITLPEVINNYIQCKTPISINILNGIVDRSIIDSLNAGDVDSAVQHIVPTHRCAEDNIIKILIDKYEKNLKNVETNITMIDSFVYDTPAERQADLNRLQKRKEELMSRIKCIKDRVNESETCCICYDNIDHKTIVTCCSNAFCFKCIHLWLSRKTTCPLCKTNINASSIYVVDNTEAQVSDAPDASDVEDPTSKIHKSNDKTRNLRNIIKSLDPSSKILIFSAYDNSFTPVSDVLNDEHVIFSFLKGNNYQIKHTLDAYKQGPTRVLLVNACHFGSGLNLENTTDIIMFHKFNNEIEKQVIGRAQRYGRTAPLRIWYLLHENEMASVSGVAPPGDA